MAAANSEAGSITASANGEVDVSVLSKVHEVLIPPIPCSFPWQNHPDYKQLTQMSDAWVLANFANLPGADGRPASFAADHLINSAFQMLATLFYPTALRERMPPIIKLFDWFFILDNFLDDPSEMGADPVRADTVVDSVLTVFRDTYVPPCASPSPPVQILTDTAAEWWMQMCERMPPKQKARLSKAFCEYLEANRAQVPYRNSRKLPNLEIYFKMRAASVGWFPCAILIEHAQAFELDDEVLSHPLVTALHQNTVQYIFLVNDITSFKKEYMQGDFCNIVSILYFKSLYEPTLKYIAPTLQGAVLEALQMIKERDDECVRFTTQIHACEQLMKKPGVATYLEVLGFHRSGTIYWHLVSGRYGICATSDLHVTPPDMLAHHIVHIEANEEATHNLPRSVMM